MKVQDKIFSAWVHTLKGPEIDKYERAEAINTYMKEQRLSQRAFAKRFDISHSTIQDWLLPLRMGAISFKKSVKEVGETSTYKLLRDTKELEVNDLSEIEREIVVLTGKLSSSCRVKGASEEAPLLLENLRKAITTFEYRFEKEFGRIKP